MDKLKRASNYQLLFWENVHKLSVSKSGFTINYVTSPTPPPNTHKKTPSTVKHSQQSQAFT